MRTVILISLSALVFLTHSQCRQAEKKNEEMILGIYGSPAPLWEKGHRLDSLNVNAVFLNWHSINDSMLLRTRSEGAKVFAEFPLLIGKGYVENHPEAWAVDDHGKMVEPATWFMGVCPTDTAFREYRTAELHNLLNRFDLDGIWLDYLHWHAQFEDPEPILPETCFCDRCITLFGKEMAVEVPPGDTPARATWILSSADSLWREWRCRVIAGWVKEMKAIVKGHDPGMLLGIYHCPWNDNEFDGAQRRILGLDYDMLRGVTDVFSPMVYHARMGRTPQWVGENTVWLCDRLGIKEGEYPRVWTIVQAYDEPYTVTPDEFSQVLHLGAAGCSSGVMMFTSRAVAQNDDKIATMRKVYGSMKQNGR